MQQSLNLLLSHSKSWNHVGHFSVRLLSEASF